jgi:ABC-type transport system involved in multi-copper enzyme maturation permease subunit
MAETVASRPNSWRVARAVSWVTLLEILRDKILYNVVVLAFLLLGIAYLGSRLSFLRQDRLMLDFGLSAVEVSCVLIAVLVGSAMVGREFERRTILVALSRPITRMQYVIGKYLGLVGVVAINWAILVALHAAVVTALGAHEWSLVGGTYAAAVLLILVEAAVMAAFAVLFSTFTTTSLAVMFCLGLYFVGSNVSQLRLLAAKSDNPVSRGALEALAAALPNLDLFRLGEKVTYSLPVGGGYVAWAVAYGLLLAAVALILAGLLVQRREF